MGGGRRIVLDGIPVRVLARYRDHLAALRSHDGGDDGEAARRLRRALEVIEGRFGRFREPNQRAVEEAVAAGRATVTLAYDLPPAFADDVLRLLDALEDVQAAARTRGSTLPVAPPAVVGFWRWMLGEAHGQLLGLDPTPYSPERAAAIAGPRGPARPLGPAGANGRDEPFGGAQVRDAG